MGHFITRYYHGSDAEIREYIQDVAQANEVDLTSELGEYIFDAALFLKDMYNATLDHMLKLQDVRFEDFISAHDSNMRPQDFVDEVMERERQRRAQQWYIIYGGTAPTP